MQKYAYDLQPITASWSVASIRLLRHLLRMFYSAIEQGFNPYMFSLLTGLKLSTIDAAGLFLLKMKLRRHLLAELSEAYTEVNSELGNIYLV